MIIIPNNINDERENSESKYSYDEWDGGDGDLGDEIRKFSRAHIISISEDAKKRG